MSAWAGRSSHGNAAAKIVPPDTRILCWKGRGADSEEKREPASDIDTAEVDSLNALDLGRPIREADMDRRIVPRISDAIDPYVWSGRALQEDFSEFEGCGGLASMYPAFDWSLCAPGHHGYQRACDLISG